jgi:2-polyprenyl-3-methyl-5-hydroxy-6-metoxy-1,4-benzoquinol methylase
VLARFAASGILLEIAATTTDLVRTAARRGWQTVTAPPTIREGLWRAGSFDAVFLCGLLHTMPDPDALLRLAAHYCRLDGLLLVEMPTIERDTMLQALAMRLQRHGFRLCWHGCLPALDGPHDTLQLTAVARYVP